MVPSMNRKRWRSLLESSEVARGTSLTTSTIKLMGVTFFSAFGQTPPPPTLGSGSTSRYPLVDSYCLHCFYTHRNRPHNLLHDTFSVEQGFWKPRRYTGKGLEGRGQGTEQLTPHKPLPMSTGKGIPFLWVSPCACRPQGMYSFTEKGNNIRSSVVYTVLFHSIRQ